MEQIITTEGSGGAWGVAFKQPTPAWLGFFKGYGTTNIGTVEVGLRFLEFQFEFYFNF